MVGGHPPSYQSVVVLYPGQGKGKRREEREIPEESCLIPEEGGVTGGTELDIGADSQRRTDVNWVPGIDTKSRISKTQHTEEKDLLWQGSSPSLLPLVLVQLLLQEGIMVLAVPV
jgi:hypothetical protein